MKAKYINPYTDFGFKKLFGEEASKPFLIDFLNSLLPEQDQIADLSFKNNEQLGIGEDERKAVYDIYCENEKGEKFIVELQRAYQNYFKERTVYYSTFPIREQAEKGKWYFDLKAVYCIGILDFTFDDYEDEPQKSEVVHTVKLKNQHGKVFYDKLTFIYLEMPNFKKQENELQSRLDKWLYFLKNLEDFQNIPSIFKDQVFTQAFETAELANFKQADWDKYEASLKAFRDNHNIVDTAFGEGIIKGENKKAIEIAKMMKQNGELVNKIIQYTGLSEDEISQL
ncbi:MAG: Rpn family recombination-promoting nuclease/putative transposase [Edaphocola sp.]